MSSTPAQSQSEVAEWTGQSPSAESWLVSQQRGGVSERERESRQTPRKRKHIRIEVYATCCSNCKQITFFFCLTFRREIVVRTRKHTATLFRHKHWKQFGENMGTKTLGIFHAKPWTHRGPLNGDHTGQVAAGLIQLGPYQTRQPE